MIFKDIDVLIYFEHVVRELDSCLMLKNAIEKLGMSAEVVPVHKNRYNTFIKYRPHIVVVPFMFADKNDIIFNEFKAIYGNVICFNLHHEQFYNKMTKSHFMPKNEDTKLAYHLSWGTNFANDLIEAGVENEKIIISGNPRTDTYYLKPIKKILEYKNGYDELIFIPTSFSWAFVDESYFLINAKIDPKVFKEKKKLTLATAKIYLKDIRRLAKKYPHKLFVIRPHPFENIETYISFLKDADDSRDIEKNILVLREGNVYDWLHVCDLMIGWITTVSMEASSFKKKNIIYTPIVLDDGTMTEFMKLYDNIICKFDDLDNIVKSISDYNQINRKVQDYITDAMGESDGNVNNRIAHAIKNISNIEAKSQIVSFRYYNNLCKCLCIDLPKNILLILGLLPKIRPLYLGVIEDMISYNQISKAYTELKQRIK